MKSIKVTGVVTLPLGNGQCDVIVSELSQAGELGLWNALKLRAKKALGPASFYANIKPALEVIEDADFKHLLATTAAKMIASGSPPSTEAIEEFRGTPAGVALEIFLRSRASAPEMTEKDVAAMVNEANCLEVRSALLQALNPDTEASHSKN